MYSYTHNLPICISRNHKISYQANKQVTSKLQALEANKQAGTLLACLLASLERRLSRDENGVQDRVEQGNDCRAKGFGLVYDDCNMKLFNAASPTNSL
jgi:hypothetical protein